MDGLNRCIVMGNLGADPELRMTQGGQGVLSLRLACTESYLDKDKKKAERTEWVTCVVWGKRAEGLAKILHKGDRVLIEGGLRTSSYEDRDGNKRYKTEVVAREVLLQGSKNGGKREPDRDRDRESPPDQDPHNMAGWEADDDSIPF